MITWFCHGQIQNLYMLHECYEQPNSLWSASIWIETTHIWPTSRTIVTVVGAICIYHNVTTSQRFQWEFARVTILEGGQQTVYIELPQSLISHLIHLLPFVTSKYPLVYLITQASSVRQNLILWSTLGHSSSTLWRIPFIHIAQVSQRLMREYCSNYTWLFA